MKNKKTLYDYFKEIKDYRRPQGRMHELPIILTIVLMAIMSWFIWERAMWDFVKKNATELKKYLKPKKWYLPSYQTIDAVLTKIGYEEVMEKFMEWAWEDAVKEMEQIAIDGKSIWWTVKNSQNKHQEYINVVSAFMVWKKKVLWGKVINTKKDNEIPAVKDLIEMLWLKWVIFTMDALHCQKKTTKAIVESWNHYVIWVKNNQKRLMKKIKSKTKNKSIDKSKTREKKQMKNRNKICENI